MRHQATISSLDRCRPSTSFLRVSAGTLSRKNARTSSRNAISSLVKARSMGSSCERMNSLRDLSRCRHLLLAQFMTREFSDRGARQLGDELQRGGQLMLAELAREMHAQLVERKRTCAVAQTDKRLGRLAAIIVGDTDHDHLMHGRMGVDRLLDHL